MFGTTLVLLVLWLVVIAAVITGLIPLGRTQASPPNRKKRDRIDDSQPRV